MYGAEQKKAEKFMFDLELELQKDAKKKKHLIDTAERRAHEIKTLLREGKDGEQLDRLGILLHGYTSLQKVLKKIGK